MTERLIVPVPVAARAEALNENEGHPLFNQAARRQSVGAVTRRSVTRAYPPRLARQIEQGGGVPQSAGASKALLVAEGALRLALLGKLPADRVAECFPGPEAFLADAVG